LKYPDLTKELEPTCSNQLCVSDITYISVGYDSVNNNAILTEYIIGQVEGQVNRLKTIERLMGGSAGFDLLRKIVLSKSILNHQN